MTCRISNTPLRSLPVVFLLHLTLVWCVGVWGFEAKDALAQSVVKGGEFRLYPNCKTPQNKIEEAVCSSEGSRRIHQNVARAYVRLYRLMEPDEQLTLEAEHFAWLDGMYEACSGNLFEEQGASDLLDQLAASMRTDCVIFRGEARKEDMQSAYGNETFLEQLSERLVRKHKDEAKISPSESPVEAAIASKPDTPSFQIMEGDLSEDEETQALLGEAERLVQLIEEEQTREIAASDPNSRDSLSEDSKTAESQIIEPQTIEPQIVKPEATASVNRQAMPSKSEEKKLETPKPKKQLEPQVTIAPPDFSDSASVIKAMAGLGRDLYQLSNRKPSQDVRTALYICLEQLKRINEIQLTGYDWTLAQNSWKKCTVAAKSVGALG